MGTETRKFLEQAKFASGLGSFPSSVGVCPFKAQNRKFKVATGKEELGEGEVLGLDDDQGC